MMKSDEYTVYALYHFGSYSSWPVRKRKDTLQQAVSAAAAPALLLSNESSTCPLWMLQ